MIKQPDDEPSLQETAYHEAGHAVACYFLHKRFKEVSIKPGAQKLGRLNYPEKMRKSIPSERELASVRREYVVSLAGIVSEGIFSGKDGFEDILPFLNLPSNATKDTQKLNYTFWKMVFIETKLLLYSPRTWQAVITLADELLIQETMRYQAAREVIRQAIEDYDAGVRDDVSARHHLCYSEFVKEIADSKIRFREWINDIYH